MSRARLLAATLALCATSLSCKAAHSLLRGDVTSAFTEGKRFTSQANQCVKLKDPVVPIKEEYALGGAVAVRWVKDGGGLLPLTGEERELALYLNRVGKNLAAQSARPTLEWTFGVLESSAINAISAPAGYVFVTRGLLKLVENEAQLAGVLAHEIAHITERHALAAYANERASQCGLALAGQEASAFADAIRLGGFLDLDKNPKLLERFMDKVTEKLITQGFAEDDEFEADEAALRLVIAAGYQPNEYIALLGKIPDGDKGYRNHPRNAERQSKLRQWLAEQRAKPGEFPDVDPEFAQLPSVPFQGQLAVVKNGR